MPCDSSDRLSDEYVRRIFQGMDVHKNGWLSKGEVHSTLLRLGLPASPHHVNNVFKSMDVDGDMKVTFAEFITFVRAREDELYDIFSRVNPKQGKLTTVKLAKALIELEMASSLQEGLNMSTDDYYQRLELSKHDTYSFREFTKSLLLMPEVDVHLVFDYWGKASKIDLGEDYLLPDEYHNIEKSRLNVFTSGAIAGFFSRTLTAPLDRLKVIMQAGKGDQSILNMLNYMYKEGGLLGFWRGNTINCIKICPESAAKFLW